MTTVKHVIGGLFGRHRAPAGESCSRGADLMADIAASLPATRIDTVFDVGANLGQSARLYVDRLPAARVWCFEPVSSTFEQLAANLRGEDRVSCHRVALAAHAGTGSMIVEAASELSRLAPSPREARAAGRPSEEVPLDTLDAFAAQHRIERINLLKVDTEGADLDVLEGAGQLLAGQRIDLVQVEAGMNPRNERHVPLGRFQAFFEAKGYWLFGLYEQMHEWPGGRPNLRRVNPVFMSQRCIEDNARPH